jgi:hypothetical protein
MKRVPTAMNVYVLPNMSRMTGRWHLEEKIACSMATPLPENTSAVHSCPFIRRGFSPIAKSIRVYAKTAETIDISTIDGFIASVLAGPASIGA